MFTLYPKPVHSCTFAKLVHGCGSYS
uniref:Uncharacterized protein n=1 Tax=Arundo donax TaxID=35708 RepID=A0A0A8ZBZ5_ARUDO